MKKRLSVPFFALVAAVLGELCGKCFVSGDENPLNRKEQLRRSAKVAKESKFFIR
jgi:hypothetical protein